MCYNYLCKILVSTEGRVVFSLLQQIRNRPIDKFSVRTKSCLPNISLPGFSFILGFFCVNVAELSESVVHNNVSFWTSRTGIFHNIEGKKRNPFPKTVFQFTRVESKLSNWLSVIHAEKEKINPLWLPMGGGGLPALPGLYFGIFCILLLKLREGVQKRKGERRGPLGKIYRGHESEMTRQVLCWRHTHAGLNCWMKRFLLSGKEVIFYKRVAFFARLGHFILFYFPLSNFLCYFVKCILFSVL